MSTGNAKRSSPIVIRVILAVTYFPVREQRVKAFRRGKDSPAAGVLLVTQLEVALYRCDPVGTGTGMIPDHLGPVSVILMAVGLQQSHIQTGHGCFRFFIPPGGLMQH